MPVVQFALRPFFGDTQKWTTGNFGNCLRLYLFSLNTPDSTLAYTAAASDRLIEQVKAVGGCATRHIEDAQTLGIIIKMAMLSR